LIPPTPEIRLQQLERILPHRAGELDYAVEPANDGVVVSLGRSPGVAQPAVFIDGERHNRPHVRVVEIHLRQPLERIENRQRYVMEIGQLIGHDAGGPGQYADCLLDAVALIDQMPPTGFDGHPADEVGQRFRRQRIKRLPHSAIQA
jgi:hypothetical protein